MKSNVIVHELITFLFSPFQKDEIACTQIVYTIYGCLNFNSVRYFGFTQTSTWGFYLELNLKCLWSSHPVLVDNAKISLYLSRG